MDLDEPVIVVADDLSPSETVQMDKEKILAFVTVHGSANSHTAILARMMNIPALIGVDMDLEALHTGTEAAVDGFHGEFFVDPSEEVKERIQRKIEEEKENGDFIMRLRVPENEHFWYGTILGWETR